MLVCLINLDCVLDFASKKWFVIILSGLRNFCCLWEQIYICFSRGPMNAIIPVQLRGSNEPQLTHGPGSGTSDSVMGTSEPHPLHGLSEP